MALPPRVVDARAENVKRQALPESLH